MKSKISLITLGVKNLNNSLRFYRDGLGFKTHHYKESENFVLFKMQGTWLSLYPRDKLAEDVAIPNNGSGFSGITFAHNVSSKEEVNKVFDEAIAAGAKSIKKPQKVFWCGYSGYFADPDGYLWEVAHNPFTDLT